MGPLGWILMWLKLGSWAIQAKELPSQSWTMVSIKPYLLHTIEHCIHAVSYTCIHHYINYFA